MLRWLIDWLTIHLPLYLNFFPSLFMCSLPVRWFTSLSEFTGCWCWGTSPLFRPSRVNPSRYGIFIFHYTIHRLCLNSLYDNTQKIFCLALNYLISLQLSLAGLYLVPYFTHNTYPSEDPDAKTMSFGLKAIDEIEVLWSLNSCSSFPASNFHSYNHGNNQAQNWQRVKSILPSIT